MRIKYNTFYFKKNFGYIWLNISVVIISQTMKKAYVSNFDCDVEISGPGSGEESNGELDPLDKETTPPKRGYVSKPNVSETPKKGLVILSDDSDEDLSSKVITQETANSGERDLNQSVSDLDFDSDIDVDEALERTLQNKKDNFKAVEDDIFGLSDEDDVDMTLNVRKRKNGPEQEEGSSVAGPEDKKYHYEPEERDFDADEGKLMTNAVLVSHCICNVCLSR